MSMVIGLVIVLGVLIFFHELGHFLTAKAFGVGVEKFSLGFGPKLASKKMGRTEYRISVLPLGGYVKMVGEEPDAEIDPQDIACSFTHKPVYQRMLIVAAGPLFNFVLCIAIFFMLFSAIGVMNLKPVVGEVRPDTPAEASGIKSGDMIVAIEGRTIETWQEMAEVVSKSRGSSMTFTVKRDGVKKDLTLVPQKETAKNLFGEEQERYMIGIVAAGETETVRLNPIEAMGESLFRTWLIIKLTVVSVVKLIQGAISVETLGGPIMIAQMAGEQVQQGAANLLSFIALVSVNLGILNLLPVPVLDGGHLVFFGIEAVKGRPVSLRSREIAQQIGIFLLMMLMVFVFYNDIMRILTG
ncbi:MAG: RIP metalloprotease RseP [Desulfobacteraceae bacterium]|nr:RIP metalloprotease RseP [Desulfobacteraceae bacterium]MCF8094159.1 RIP metalloprotease RseP [Desulfobacteraceae bacterium]